jgi:diadenylate cyclase
MEILQLYLGDLRVTDLIDIALLWFVIYQALLLVRGTRALQSLLGLGAALALYVLAGKLELYAMHWLLEKFFDIAVLAVIVLFSADIKRGLAGAGGRLFPSFGPRADQSAFEEVIRASFLLASRRIGALIAIEREATLQEYADAGTRLEARLSSELLLSVFHPTSPLHDGAVVVERGRLVAAKVFLPLSLSREISRFVGTRHRAAIGLTEETDAVVVIVSEETGRVGLVVAGEVRPVATADEMRQKLLEVFAQEPKPAPETA